MKLSSKLIRRLNGKPIRLSTEFSNGKLLSEDCVGELSFKEPGSSEYNQKWRLSPVEGGFLIVSVNTGKVICYQEKHKGVQLLGIPNKRCIWKVSTNGEFYQPKLEGEEKSKDIFLWSANGKLYSTTDGYLAEVWNPLDVDELPEIYQESRKFRKPVMIGISLVVASLIIAYIAKRSFA